MKTATKSPKIERICKRMDGWSRAEYRAFYQRAGLKNIAVDMNHASYAVKITGFRKVSR